MNRKGRQPFESIRTEGALLPAELLQRIAGEDRSLGGLNPEDYHLSGERLREAIARSWSRLQSAWRHFEAARATLGETDLGTSITRERWLLPLFQELQFGRLSLAGRLEVEGKSYPVSHLWRNVPIHLVGCAVDLDSHTKGAAGAARTTPHGLVQELLNRRDDFLWGVVSNGLVLRILRDSRALTRQAYVELDLEAMLRGERYSDFALLWLLHHQSRFEAERPTECWLEKWTREAAAQGTRALEQLRRGVEQAIVALGRGFLAPRENHDLREFLRKGELATQDYYRELLRIVYRLLFLFVAEDRGLLLDPKADAAARDRYRRWYSTARLRQLAERRRGGPHVDLWRSLRLVMQHLEKGCPGLALPALGSFLWSSDAALHLNPSDLQNRDLLEAIRHLAFTEDGSSRRAVDWKNLGSEELGSVYESLLELHPRISAEHAQFELDTAGGHERKTSGSYYTPRSLVDCLLDSALESVLADTMKKPDPERAILALKVCDPACGSGHFLIAAAHRMARRLASVRSGDAEPSPEATRTALRDVIGHCLYGVDLNPMAVELCKVALWMEALEPGKPLTFLSSKIREGNSLLGTTPKLLQQGIPDAAFEALEGDDKKVVADAKKQNKAERKGQRLMFAEMVAEPVAEYGALSRSMQTIEALPDDTLDHLQVKEQKWRNLITSEPHRREELRANAWCAAFVWRKAKDSPPYITQDVFKSIERRPERVDARIIDEVERLKNQYHFFHWHVEFPDVFRPDHPEMEDRNEEAGWTGGFDCVLGNPPWERIKLQEKEFFAQRCPEIAEAPNAAARRKRIDELATKDASLLAAFYEELRQSEGESHFVRESGRYPLTGRGDINTYAIFAETMRLVQSTVGRVGIIVPSGVATDDTTKLFFQELVEGGALVSLFDFENREGIFEGVHRSYKFCLLTLTGLRRPTLKGSDFVFFAHCTADLQDAERHFTLSAPDLTLLNPNTRTCPVFRSKRDAELTKAIYRRVPILVKEGPPEENPWGLFIRRVFDLNKRETLTLLRPAEESDGTRCVKMYESKLIHQFDHRWATYDGDRTRDLDSNEKTNPDGIVRSRYAIPAAEVDNRIACYRSESSPNLGWTRSWLLAWRDICRNTDARTVIATALPRSATDFTLRVAFPTQYPEVAGVALLSNLNSFVLDYLCRQVLGGIHLSDYVTKQLPVLPPSTYDLRNFWHSGVFLLDWLRPRVLELVFTSYDLSQVSRDLDYAGPPFRWNEERRFQIRCELDGAFFHLYLGPEDAWRNEPTTLTTYFSTPRHAVDYILDTFPIVRRDDEKHHGHYRTKTQILDIYDRMTQSILTGTPYQTILKPPPGDPSCAHAKQQAQAADSTTLVRQPRP